jgi:hypothetical protein
MTLFGLSPANLLLASFIFGVGFALAQWLVGLVTARLFVRRP